MKIISQTLHFWQDRAGWCLGLHPVFPQRRSCKGRELRLRGWPSLRSPCQANPGRREHGEGTSGWTLDGPPGCESQLCRSPGQKGTFISPCLSFTNCTMETKITSASPGCWGISSSNPGILRVWPQRAWTPHHFTTPSRRYLPFHPHFLTDVQCFLGACNTDMAEKGL